MAKFIQFNMQDLIPREWKHVPAPVRVFNPTLIRNNSHWIMAYRLVGEDQKRRIALCSLNDNFEVVVNSTVAFSDYISGVNRDWFADPRLYKLKDKFYIYWNTGWHEPRNYQYLQAIDPVTYLPMGSVFEMNVKVNQNPLEKNWMLFGDSLEYTVYSINPHRILSSNMSENGSSMEDLCTTTWDNLDFEKKSGKLRGGAPPQLIAGEYFSICHTVTGTENNYIYSAACYSFSAVYPFKPTRKPSSSLLLPNPKRGSREYPKLNAAVGEVIYPCGAIYENGLWYISYGINDETCAIAILEHEVLLASTTKIA
jgi:predicted GH43/DUF377 family glycosyl hydrolase